MIKGFYTLVIYDCSPLLKLEMFFFGVLRFFTRSIKHFYFYNIGIILIRKKSKELHLLFYRLNLILLFDYIKKN